jgi:hypothetical protein
VLNVPVVSRRHSRRNDDAIAKLTPAQIVSICRGPKDKIRRIRKHGRPVPDAIWKAWQRGSVDLGFLAAHVED